MYNRNKNSPLSVSELDRITSSLSFIILAQQQESKTPKTAIDTRWRPPFIPIVKQPNAAALFVDIPSISQPQNVTTERQSQIFWITNMASCFHQRQTCVARCAVQSARVRAKRAVLNAIIQTIKFIIFNETKLSPSKLQQNFI